MRAIICSSGLGKGKQICLFPVLQSTCVLSSKGCCKHKGGSGLRSSSEEMNPQHQGTACTWLLSPGGTPTPLLNRGKPIWNNLWSHPGAPRKASLPSELSQPRAVVWGVLSAQRAEWAMSAPPGGPTNTTPDPQMGSQAPPLTSASPHLVPAPPRTDWTSTSWLSLNTSHWNSNSFTYLSSVTLPFLPNSIPVPIKQTISTAQNNQCCHPSIWLILWKGGDFYLFRLRLSQALLTLCRNLWCHEHLMQHWSHN